MRRKKIKKGLDKIKYRDIIIVSLAVLVPAAGEKNRDWEKRK